MSKLLFQVLLVDDEVDRWSVVKDDALVGNRFSLIKADTLSSAYEFLNDCWEVVDAVLLEYNFESPDADAVLDFIKKVKRLSVKLPVFLICSDNHPEDGVRIVELIKAGADDYIGRVSFGNEFLVEKVKAASERRNEHKMTELLTESYRWCSQSNPEFPFLQVKKRKGKWQGVFGYRLQAVVRARTEHEEEHLQINAYKWHSAFYSMLVYLLDDDIKFSLHYSTRASQECGHVWISLIFSLEASSREDVQTKFLKATHDLHVFTSVKPGNIPFPYFFVPLLSEEEIELVRSNYQGEKIGFVRKGVEQEKQGAAGFNSTVNQSPSLLIPLSFSLSILEINSFLTYMYSQRLDVDLVAEISHAKLTVEEYQLLENRRKKIRSIQLSDQESKLLDHIENLTQGADLYQVSFFLSGKGVLLQDSLTTFVSNCFFGGKYNTHAYDVSSEAYKKICNDEQSRLLFYYPPSDMARVFRLPYPSYYELRGVPLSYKSYFDYPDNLPRDGILIGEKKTSQQPVPIYLGQDDLKLHSYILGQTGTGKSTLLFTMMRHLLCNHDCGFGLIDPHGDLFNNLLEILPENRKKDIVLFDPTADDNDIQFNVLACDLTKSWEKSMVINSILGIIDQVYDLKETGGPIFIKGFSAALGLAIENKLTLLDAVEFWQDKDRLEIELDRCTNERVVNSWREFLRVTGDHSFDNIAPYFTSKFNELTDNEIIARVIGASNNAVSFRDMIDQGKIFVCKLPKGKLAERGLYLMGSLLFSQFMIAAFSRDDIAFEDRKQFVLFVDEFQNFTSKDLINSFSEARKYNLHMVIANQNLNQLKPEMLHSVLGNVGNLIFFRVGLNDVERVSPYFKGYFTEEEIVNLPNYNCIARLNVDSIPVKPFIFSTVR